MKDGQIHITRCQTYRIRIQKHLGVKTAPRGQTVRPAKGIIFRWGNPHLNKLLTTAFEASLESVAVTLQAKRRQQDKQG